MTAGELALEAARSTAIQRAEDGTLRPRDVRVFRRCARDLYPGGGLLREQLDGIARDLRVVLRAQHQARPMMHRNAWRPMPRPRARARRRAARRPPARAGTDDPHRARHPRHLTSHSGGRR